jgi:hypothetical protein
MGFAILGLLAAAPVPLPATGEDARQAQELERRRQQPAGAPGRARMGGDAPAVAPERPAAQVRESRPATGPAAPSRVAPERPAVQVREARPTEGSPARVAPEKPAVQVREAQPAAGDPPARIAPGRPAVQVREAQPAAGPSTPARVVPDQAAGPQKDTRPNPPGANPMSGKDRPGANGGSIPWENRPSDLGNGRRDNNPSAGRGGRDFRPVDQTPGPTVRPVVPGMAVVRTHDGGEIRRNQAGAVREVATQRGAVIRIAPDGVRRMEVARPDGRVVVANAAGRMGYVQRPIQFHERPLIQRSYVERGMVTTRVYRPWVYRGTTFNIYMSNRYCRPAFYTWAYRPWSRPVAYRWGWDGRPWCGYYRTYYSPYPYYPSPVFWLTDFIFSATLEVAYQDRLDSGTPIPPPVSSQTQLTPEVKQAIADEVRLQLEEERDAQALAGDAFDDGDNAPPPLFSGNVSRIFLVSHSLPAYDHGRECYLSEGDVLQLNGPPPPNSSYANVVVLASRTGALAKGSVVAVSLVDLQEMQNQMRANLDRGLGDLQTHAGQGGLPAPPPQSLGATDAAYAAALRPDADAAGELSQAAQEADRDSQSLIQQAPAYDSHDIAATEGTVTLGMSIQQVQAILGAPSRSAKAGAKRIDIYQDFKITFMDGRVTDIQ